MDFFNRKKYTKEDIQYLPYSNMEESVYVVRIPRSYNAPHLSSDKDKLLE